MIKPRTGTPKENQFSDKLWEAFQEGINEYHERVKELKKDPYKKGKSLRSLEIRLQKAIVEVIMPKVEEEK